ncbi:MAG: M23 family metallopeptidase [Thermaerobacter sp.]
MEGPSGGGMRGSGAPRTWRDDYDLDVAARTISRRRRSPAPGVLLPARIPVRLLRQCLYAAAVVVLAAAAFRLPYDLGTRLQGQVAALLTRDVDLEQAALAIRDAVQQGRAWLAGAVDRDGSGGGGALPAAVPEAGPQAWVWPAAGTALAGYGWTEGPDGEAVLHEGLDIAAEPGAPAVAAAAGTVRRVWTEAGGGVGVEIDHGGGWTSRYLNLQEAYVAAGDPVQAGDVIAVVGEPAHGAEPSLHFEIRRDGSPVDPEPKLRRDEGSW